MKAGMLGLTTILGALIGLGATLLPTPVQAQRGGGPITCGSVDGRYARCRVDWRDARLVHQDSDTRCIRDRNWGIDRGGLWVDKGCRGQFVEAGGYGGGGRPGREQVIACGSVDGRYQSCPANVGRGADVRLVANESDTRCVQGRNWGVNRDGIWVNNGCRGRFAVRGGGW